MWCDLHQRSVFRRRLDDEQRGQGRAFDLDRPRRDRRIDDSVRQTHGHLRIERNDDPRARPASGQSADILDIYSASGGLGSVITAGGSLGLGTTTPGSILSINGVGNFVAGATSTLYNALTVGGNLSLNGIANGILSTNAAGQVVATTSIGTNLLIGNLATINGTTVANGGSYTISAASSTLLIDNNTFAGNDIFNNLITGSVSGNAGTATALQNARTINGVSFNGTANITLTAASSTLLANNNTFSGTNAFANTTFTNATFIELCDHEPLEHFARGECQRHRRRHLYDRQ